jgi:hypothetical protein
VVELKLLRRRLEKERKTSELAVQWVKACSDILADERFGWAVEREMLEMWLSEGE